MHEIIYDMIQFILRGFLTDPAHRLHVSFSSENLGHTPAISLL